jgi:hypothetical protein
MKSIIFVVICLSIIFTGCTEISDTSNDGTSNNGGGQPKTNYNIGDTMQYGNFKYTFVSVNWVESWDRYYYKLEIKAENIGIAKESSTVEATLIVMENGYQYEPSWIYDTESVDYSVNPGKDSTKTISISDYTIDRDFLPVDKIHLNVDYKNIILNV